MGCHCLLQIDYILIAYIAIYVYTDILVKDDDNKLEITYVVKEKSERDNGV